MTFHDWSWCFEIDQFFLSQGQLIVPILAHPLVNFGQLFLIRLRWSWKHLSRFKDRHLAKTDQVVDQERSTLDQVLINQSWSSIIEQKCFQSCQGTKIVTPFSLPIVTYIVTFLGLHYVIATHCIFFIYISFSVKCLQLLGIQLCIISCQFVGFW